MPDNLGEALARNWWLIALRGVLGVIFGVIALVMPVATILALVLLFSAYMIVDGAFAIYAAIRAARKQELGLPAVSRYRQPRRRRHRICLAQDHRACLRAAHRRLVDCLGLLDARCGHAHRKWPLVARPGRCGGIALRFLMIVAPLAGAVVLTWWLGAFALVFGVALIILSLKLRSRYSGAGGCRPAPGDIDVQGPGTPGADV